MRFTGWSTRVRAAGSQDETLESRQAVYRLEHWSQCSWFTGRNIRVRTAGLQAGALESGQLVHSPKH
jgi:hypothetical protein